MNQGLSLFINVLLKCVPIFSHLSLFLVRFSNHITSIVLGVRLIRSSLNEQSAVILEIYAVILKMGITHTNILPHGLNSRGNYK